MRKVLYSAFAMGLFLSASPVAAQMEMKMADHETVEITATVVDLSCKSVYNLGGDDHRMCSQVCADAGIPLGLLTADGNFLVPVSAGMPGTGANEMLKEHAERQVRIKGKLIERGGMTSIIIDEISAAE